MQKTDYVNYEPAVLERLHSTLVMMLNDFVSVCEENNIDYFAIGGTASGAVRHNGLIPWDDDIDIAFRRIDEDRLISLIKEKYGDKYWFANPQIEKDFPYIPTHMCLKGTTFKEKQFPHEHRSGVFLDLYPFDDVYDDPKKRRKQVMRAWLWGKLYIMYFTPKPVLYYSGLGAKLVHFGCGIGNKIMHILRVQPRKLYERALQYSTECARSGEASESITWMHDPTPFGSILAKDDIFPTRRMPFENIEIRVPLKVESYLEEEFGDYMELPAEDARHNHPPDNLIF